MRRMSLVTGLGVVTVVGGVWLASSSGVLAQAPATSVAGASATSAANGSLSGGPRGLVKTAKGDLPVTGLMIQLISQKTAIRTTVYTNERGQYEFPKLEAGTYTLRLARPLEYRQHQRDNLQIDGATPLADILLERVAESELLPATPDILPQLSGAEWIENMPGTTEEKRAFVNTCGAGCHTLDYPFRVRFDQASWTKLIHRMTSYSQRTLVPPGTVVNNRRAADAAASGGEEGEYGSRGSGVKTVANWLGRIRGLDTKIPSIKPFPRPVGPATRAVVTEYEIPWELMNIHDVAGDAEGNIWFTINRAPFIGKLDPNTGKVTQYRVPSAKPMATPLPGSREQKMNPKIGIVPGLHWIQVDHNTGYVWATDTWSQALVRLDPRTGDIQTVSAGISSNAALSPDGLWIARLVGGVIRLYDTKTVMQSGKPVKEIPTRDVKSTYGNFFSHDGRYFGGAGEQGFRYDMKTGEVKEMLAPSLDVGQARGDFDRNGNLWGGGKSGKLVKYDPNTGAVGEYAPPTPYVNFYTARSDKNGEIWAGEMSGGRVARFNPKTYQWIEYVLPSPYAMDFNSWVDNSTDPPTYWYGDEYGFITRIQPLQ